MSCLTGRVLTAWTHFWEAACTAENGQNQLDLSPLEKHRQYSLSLYFSRINIFQLCLFAAMNVAWRTNGTVIYIDTGNNFSASRLLQMYKATKQQFTVSICYQHSDYEPTLFQGRQRKERENGRCSQQTARVPGPRYFFVVECARSNQIHDHYWRLGVCGSC